MLTFISRHFKFLRNDLFTLCLQHSLRSKIMLLYTPERIDFVSFPGSYRTQRAHETIRIKKLFRNISNPKIVKHNLCVKGRYSSYVEAMLSDANKHYITLHYINEVFSTMPYLLCQFFFFIGCEVTLLFSLQQMLEKGYIPVSQI